ncbi:MAG: hypothetical protein CMF41_03975 [Legionellales bacterium]|nr:hypothetical protein [Legionellales bacterium]OUX65046.1 MAG: hypothetical protein CBE41_02260 [Gammaproteobacteria bacterium TMED281]
MKHYHFVGILGCGMRALVEILLQRGEKVTGTDSNNASNASFSKPIEISTDRSEHSKKCNYLIFSTAISQDHPDLQIAKRNHIPCLHRSELIQKIIEEHTLNIAITGTHGKTTTSALVSFIFEQCDQKPTYAIGGSPTRFPQSQYSNDQTYFIFESDESDGSFLNTYPSHILINNFESDHLEMHDDNFEQLQQTLIEYSQRAEIVFVCSDDSKAYAIAKKSKSVITYGFNPSDYQIISIQKNDKGMSLEGLYSKTNEKFKIKTSLHGDYNATNIFGAVSIAHHFGISFKQIATAIPNFEGVKRRMEKIGVTTINNYPVTVYDDYAHHPTEISAISKMVDDRFENTILICQPHRNSRVKHHFNAYVESLSKIKNLILLTTYEPSSNQNEDYSKALFDTVSKTHDSIIYADESSIKQSLHKIINAPSVAVFIGAGSISQFAHNIVNYE